ncbi:MAG: FecR family protein [Terracidiphilus sp.]
MKSTYFSKAMTFLPLLLLALGLQAQSNDATNPNPGMSKVRIVRLSQVKGSVQIDRSDGRGYERGIANLPIVEHNQLRTGEGIAEVEFEDNSSLRLAPNSLVEFPSLERSASGATISSVHLIEGTAYISLVKPQNSKAAANEFTVIFGNRTLNLDPATHVRLDLAGTEAKLAVLDGSVHVGEANGAVIIPKKRTATFQTLDASEPTVARSVEASPFDGWDHEAASYHSGVAAFSAFNSPYAYGLRDLSYYGSFVNSAGCGGSMWRPYFASAAWDPFANGTWAWYQGAGYSWVSPYPWGWTPYHSGSWAYCGDVGWGWMPGEGGGWYGVNNVAALTPMGRTTGSSGRMQPPHLPIHPPLPHAPSMIAINTKPIPVSQVASPTKFEFLKDSAGLGVPRGTLGNLNKFSRTSISRGIASTAIYATVPRAGQSIGGGITRSEMLSASIHRGYAPTFGSSSPGNYSGTSYAGSSNAGGMSGGGGSSAGSAPAASGGPSGGGGVRK